MDIWICGHVDYEPEICTSEIEKMARCLMVVHVIVLLIILFYLYRQGFQFTKNKINPCSETKKNCSVRVPKYRANGN